MACRKAFLFHDAPDFADLDTVRTRKRGKVKNLDVSCPIRSCREHDIREAS